VGPVTLRDATVADAAAVAHIYNQAVVGSTATFDTEPKSPEDRVAWLKEHDAAHPVIVAERDGEVVGWGSLSSTSDRKAWDQTVEISTYVDEGHTGTGVGHALGQALIDRARGVGLHVVVSRVCADNDASIRLATGLGFETLGTMHEVGRKFGRWLDVVIMEKRL
jgi:phosphinothricin acetyltransferase